MLFSLLYVTIISVLNAGISVWLVQYRNCEKVRYCPHKPANPTEIGPPPQEKGVQKRWGGPSKSWGGPDPPDPPSGCALGYVT